MGCCGHDFISNQKIREALKKNTSEFGDRKTSAELISFRDRFYSSNLRDGVCRNLIEKEGKILCPLHPVLNNDEDLRKGHCNINYLCKTAKEFDNWSKEKQEKFVKFIGSMNLDNISYSMMMDKGELLKEFESKR